MEKQKNLMYNKIKNILDLILLDVPMDIMYKHEGIKLNKQKPGSQPFFMLNIQQKAAK